MDDRYLWDRSGPADPEVERLENLLGTLRHAARPAPRLPRARRRWAAVAAAALLAVTGGIWLARMRGSANWRLTPVSGSPSVGSSAVTAGRAVRAGDTIETDARSRALLRVGSIGEVDVRPGSRLRLIEARRRDHRLALEQGSIAARIWAPPRLFFVETPSALAVDLGCAYTLAVEPGGAGRLAVTAGWVELEREGREALVPAGAHCQTRPGIGPGSPVWDDAPPALSDALERYEFGTGGSAALAVVLENARRRDGLTLWHLLARSRGEDFRRIYDRLSELAPPPAGVTRQGIEARDDAMLEAWRDRLGIRWFRKEPTFWQRLWLAFRSIS
jgi:hypothetical protein